MLEGYRIAAVCISRIHEEVLREFIESLSKSLAPHGWRVMVFATGSDLFHQTQSDKGEEAVFDLIDPDFVDSLLVFDNKVLDPSCKERILHLGLDAHIPTFIINGSYPGCTSLNFDYERGFERVVRHLIEDHHIRDFHFIAGMKDNEFSDNRIKVMQNVLDEYGIPLGGERISYGDFWSVPARAAARKLIEENRLPQAIVCANDTMAIAVSAELQHHGLRIPEDVIVTGFDGIDEIAFCIPKMTSATCDFQELGQKAAELCIRTGNGESVPSSVLLVPRLVLQESCGCHAKQDMDMVDFITKRNDQFFRFQNEGEKLSELSSRIQSSSTLQEVSHHLHDRIFYCVQCMIKAECIDFSLDPMVQHSASPLGEELYILLDSDWQDNEGSRIHKKDLAMRMGELLRSGMPLIFAALHNIDLPIGYMCYTYQSFEGNNYLKINQNTMFLGPALAGFRSRRYLQHLQAVVEDMYKYDTLTGLFNRSAFIKQIRGLCIGEGEALTLVLADLDGLKYINDYYSHSEGDFAIASVARALHDVCLDGICCRYGGDELLALLPYEADADEIRTAILEKLSIANAHADKPYTVSASIGVYTSGHESFEEMFAAADSLMYQDKSQKPNRRK